MGNSSRESTSVYFSILSSDRVRISIGKIDDSLVIGRQRFSREKMIDNVESKLYQKALEGEGWAVCFFLKTQGKRRGYIERQEHTGEDGREIVFRVKYADGD